MRTLLSGDTPATPAAKRSQVTVSSAVTIALLAIVIGLVIVGFVHIGRYQNDLAGVREEARQLRMARQALMETNNAISDLLIRQSEHPDFLPYVQGLNRLNGFDEAKLPASVSRGGQEFPVRQILGALRLAWSDIVAALNVEQHERARSLYATREVNANLAALTRAIATELDGREAAYSAVQAKVQQAIASVFTLQILTGLICIAAFLIASRNSTRDSRARALAVTSANASREQLSHLFAMTDMLQSASDHDDANAVLRSTAGELIPAFSGALYIFSNSRDRLTLSTSWKRDGAEELPDSIGLQQCWALKRGKAHINRPDSHKLCCEHHTGGDFTLEIPMIARGEILGLLQIFASGEGAERRLQDVTGIGAALADGMSLALSNIALRDKLRSQALRDPLTGLYNRRYMEDALERTVRLAEREHADVSVIMLDLDHFKRLNDQYGHAKGDSVLRDAASAIVSQLRETDIACRYGGEELIIVMPNCGMDAAAIKAERIRASIESLSTQNGAQVSASFGVASTPSTSTTSKEVLAHADAALYRAKQEGRNRVVRAPQLNAREPVPAERPAQPLELVAAE